MEKGTKLTPNYKSRPCIVEHTKGGDAIVRKNRNNKPQS